MSAPHLHIHMTAEEHILHQLQKLAEPQPVENIGNTPLEEAILAKVLSKKFRKLKADETTMAVAKRAIHTAVETKQPVTVSYLFGGNKLWRFDEAPEVDWAELFALFYFLRWMKTIASVYEPGARLDFYSEDVAVEALNNVTREETERYSRTFRALIDWLEPYIPDNIVVTHRRYGEEYASYEDFLQELEVGKARIMEQNHGNLPVLSEIQKAATELNVRLLPDQDKDPLWREKTEVIHRGLEETDTLLRYLNDPSLIMACPTSYSGWVATGSTKKSLAKFWAGVGVLERDSNDFNELVLTPKQLEAAQFDWQTVHLDGLQGKNFSRIRVLK